MKIYFHTNVIFYIRVNILSRGSEQLRLQLCMS
jgi:hypothetical protein